MAEPELSLFGGGTLQTLNTRAKCLWSPLFPREAASKCLAEWEAGRKAGRDSFVLSELTQLLRLISKSHHQAGNGQLPEPPEPRA